MKTRACLQPCSAAVMMLMVLPQSSARADIGWPPLSPGGSSLEAPQGVNTNIRMLAEEVNLSVEPFERQVPANQEDSPAYHIRALAEAEFQMRNLGAADESFDVWFPLAASLRYPGMLPYWPDTIVSDFKVWVDGEPTATEQVQAPDVGDPTQQSTWARFAMTFPARQDVTVRVNYTHSNDGNILNLYPHALHIVEQAQRVDQMSHHPQPRFARRAVQPLQQAGCHRDGGQFVAVGVRNRQA